MMSEPSDETLIADAKAGSSGAFNEIVARYERRVYAIALRMCGEPEAARDVSQEVFLTAMRAIKGFRGDARISTWLHRVAVNASLDHLRKAKRREGAPLEAAGDVPATGDDPEAAAIAADRARAVHAALARLAEDFRAPIVLHDLEGLDYTEIAATLEIPIGTVKSRIHRARLELATLLGHLRSVEPSEDPGPLR